MRMNVKLKLGAFKCMLTTVLHKLVTTSFFISGTAIKLLEHWKGRILLPKVLVHNNELIHYGSMFRRPL